MLLPSDKKESFDSIMQKSQVLVAAEMEALSAQIKALFQHKGHWVQQIAQYAFQAPGKQVRPILVLLVAGVCGGITPKAQRGALLIMLLHQASLIHDDVVDESMHRRAKLSIHAAWSNKAAVLFGDYLLATSLRLATQHQDHDFLALISETAQAMSEGELLQLAQARTFDTTKAIYLEIIYKKTAHLFGTCLAVGATAAGASAARVAAFRQVGEQVGMAFQLKDDWLDYSTEDTGKSLGTDLKEGKLTLPLIHALQQVPLRDRKAILHTLKHAQRHPQQQEEILSFVRESPGMDYTQAMMRQYQHKALKTLANTASSPYQEALCTLIQYII
jgi:octaprenyl-diphosphate synthase